MNVISNIEIEQMDYSINRVADLKMRYEMAVESLGLIQEAIKSGDTNKAYEISVNNLAMITGEHDANCSMEVDWRKETDSYRCECYLIPALP